MCNIKAIKRKLNPNIIRYPKSISKPKDPNALNFPKLTFKVSKKNVNGEINTTGFKLMGVNNGLINIKGNLISMVRIMVEAGVSVGGTERIRLKEENENAANNIPGIIISTLRFFHNSKKTMPNINGTVQNRHPKINELQTFPRSIVLIETGQVINRSSVFCLVSHGNTTGPIEVEVRKRTIAIKPDIM